MSPKEFVESFKKDAIECEKQSGISAIAILAQAAHESGWGKFAVGNMFFGVKDTDGVNGNEQLITTTEYNKSANKTPTQIGLHSISKIEPVTISGVKFFKYVGKAYFRKYDRPSDSFIDHAKFIQSNSRYQKALEVKKDPYAFVKEVAKAGYAQDPSYAELLTKMCKMIERLI